MGRPALSEARIAAFRDELVELALRRFAEDGYAGVTLRGLARDLGVSHAMMYRYVADLDDLFAAVRLRSLERFAAYHEARLAPIDDAREALREGARSYVDFAASEPHAFRVLFDLHQPDLDAHPELKAAHRRAFRILEKILRRAVDTGVVRGDPAALTLKFWAATHGLVTLHLAGQLASRRALAALAVSMADALVAGLAPGVNAEEEEGEG
jgi:AcrR family transcriptional regulator